MMLKPISKMQGAATLALTLMLLFSITMMGIYSAKSAITEQRASNNEYQAKLAFEAAEAGLEFGGVYLDANKSNILVDADTNGTIDGFTSADTSNVSQTNGTNYTITYTNPISTAYNIIQVSAVGLNPDGTVSRTISQLYANVPAIETKPAAGVIAKGAVNFGGNMTITNTVNGNTIWSGGSVALSGSASTNTGSGGSDRNTIGPDVTQNDTALSALSNEQFFQKFFSEDMATTKANANSLYQGSGNTNYSSQLNGKEAELIWIEHSSGEARINSNTVIGSPEKPVVLVVDADLKMNGGLTIYGTVYVTKDFINSGGGNLEIHGALVVNGDIQSTGTPNVIYTEEVLNKVQEAVGKYTKLPGSWIDL